MHLLFILESKQDSVSSRNRDICSAHSMDFGDGRGHDATRVIAVRGGWVKSKRVLRKHKTGEAAKYQYLLRRGILSLCKALGLTRSLLRWLIKANWYVELLPVVWFIN